MIAYFDTSALVKLLVEEPGSATTERAWLAAHIHQCSTIGRTEAAAALARAWRTGRIRERALHLALDDLSSLWAGIVHAPVDDELAADAANLAVTHALRGFDAVHLAAANLTGATFVTADRDLGDAASACGLDWVDVNS